MLKFDEKSFRNILLGYTSYWEYKPTNAFHGDSPGVYTSEKFIKLSTKDKTQSNCEAIGRSLVNGVRETVLYSFALDKPPGYKIFFKPETIRFKK